MPLASIDSIAAMTTFKAPMRIVLIEDSEILCQLMRSLFDNLKDIELVGRASSEVEAVALLADLQPDLVVIDLELKPGSGLRILSTVSRSPEKFGHPTLVVYTNHSQPAVQAMCTSLGASAFFDKSFQLDDLLDFVSAKAALHGEPDPH